MVLENLSSQYALQTLVTISVAGFSSASYDSPVLICVFCPLSENGERSSQILFFVDISISGNKYELFELILWAKPCYCCLSSGKS